MAPNSERLELAKLCSSHNWSKAIRILDSLISRSCSIQDLCNRAFCYSQLELHKHAIKDCDRAIELDLTVLQAYILKGNAFSALGRKEDALHVWEEGYSKNIHESTDIKQMLKLEKLLESVKQNSVLSSKTDSDELSNAMVVQPQTVEVSNFCRSDTIDSSDAITLNFNPEFIVGKDSTLYPSNTTTLSADEESNLSEASYSSNICTQPSDATEKLGRSDMAFGACKNWFVAGNTKTNSIISLDIWLSRGIAQVNEGKYDDAISIFDQVLSESPNYEEALIGRGTAYAFKRELKAAIYDFTVAIMYNPSAGEAWKRRGQARAALGEFEEATEDLTKALEFEPNSSDILHERGIVSFKFKDYHSAVKDLSACVKCDEKNKSAYTYLDYWCKKMHPKNVCERVFRQPALRYSLKNGRLNKREFAFTKQKASLLQAADRIGQKLQCNCPGFLPNKRQYRMAGLAAIEIAQKVAKAWRSLRMTSKSGKKTRRREWPTVQSFNRGGVCCSTGSFSETSTYSLSKDKYSSNHFITWKDIYSIAVKWRQISEPCDPVVWINHISEEADSNIGSQSTILYGQAKVIRNFEMNLRILNVALSIMRETKCVHADHEVFNISEVETLKKMTHVESCSDLYSIVGKDFWVATKCESTAYEGKKLEGMRISIQRMSKNGFDFAIQTPSTSSRWDDYDTEMNAAWEDLCTAYCNDLCRSNDLSLLENVKDAILRMAYYWYNFRPLARGSAVVGYTVLLGLFLAANMEVTASIPPGILVDWEALLSPNSKLFINSVGAWLFPSLKYSVSWKEYPDVASTFSTTGSAVAALSTFFLS